MLVGLWVRPVAAQQIYKWTDAQGKVHFGNAPPPDAKDIASDGSASRIEAECQAKAKRSCERDSSTFDRSVNGPSTDVARRCREQMTASCVQNATNRNSRVAPPTQRTLVTERVSFDPKTGDHLVCHMTCPSDCTGSLEIWGAENLARAENPGSKDFTVRVTPSSAGSAYCRATTAETRGAIVLNLMRGEAVVASAAGK
jgi:hypothetical protein